MDEQIKAPNELRRREPARAASQDQLRSLRAEMFCELRSLEATLRLDIESAQADVARAASRNRREFTEINQRMGRIDLSIRHLNDSVRQVLANDPDSFRRELANLEKQLSRLQSRITTLETARRL